MNKRISLVACAALSLVAACGRTESGDVVVKRPVDVDVKTKTETLTTKTETVNTPAVIGTKRETVVVDKPVVGTKKTEIKVPVVKKP